jgi:hypothetical protein
MPSIFDELKGNNAPSIFDQLKTQGNVFDEIRAASVVDPNITPKRGYGGSIVSAIAPAIDVLSRPQYASAMFFNSMMDNSKSVFDAISDAFNEFIDPQRKLSYADVIKERAPEFAKANPKATAVLGFLGDVALDPTTYLGVGLAGKGVKVGSKIVTEAGEGVLKNLIRTMEGKQFLMSFGDEAVKKELSKKGVGFLTKEVLVQKQSQINFHRISEALDELKESEFKSLENVQRQLGKKGIVVDIDQLASPIFNQQLKNKERKLTKQLLLEERSKIEPIVNREIDIAAINKQLESKGLDAKVSISKPKEVKAEIASLEKIYADQMADLGIDNVKTQGRTLSRELAEGDLGGVNFGVSLTKRLSVEEIQYKAEHIIQTLANLDPKVSETLFKKPSLSLKLEVPFTKYSKQLATLTGLGPLGKSIDFIKALNHSIVVKGIPIASPIARMLELTGEAGKKTKDVLSGLFVRPKDEPFKSVITEFENQFDYIEGQVIRETKRLFKDMTKDRRDRITKVFREIDDNTRRIEFLEDRVLTQNEADSIFSDALANTNLDAQEMSVVAGLKQELANVAALEMDSNLLKTEIKNYFPRYYDALQDAHDMSAITQTKYGLSTNLTSSQKRKYVTLQEAELAGHIPELDAATIYATRVSSSRRALAKTQFFDNLEESLNPMYQSITGEKLIIRNQNDLAKLGKLPNGERYLNDIKLLGESVYPTGMNTTMKAAVKFIDTLTGMFRKSATVFKPSFAPKQAFSNTAQIMLELGLKGGQTFDPRAVADASLLLMDFYRGKKTSTLPKYISNLISSNFGGEGSNAVLASRTALENIIGEERLLDVADEFKRVTAFGQTYTGQDLIRTARENNVIRGFDSTGGTFKKKIQDSLQFNPNNRWAVTKELATYWKHPAIVEDYGRMVSYINFITQGYSPKQAANKVNEILFDYGRGLTQFERRARQVIPFYTFQRFAIPFVMKKMLQEPGTVAAANKLTGLMERLMTGDGDMLSPSERAVFGDSFLVEQPSIFTGFDKEGKAKFNILNNMTPLDAMSLMVYDKNGDFDPKRTVEKTVLAALTPFLKIPLEVTLDKNYFTGRTVSEGQRIGDYSFLPKFVKDAIGWEDRVNLATGKTQTYVNTYLGYSVMQAVPALKQWINIGDSSQSLLDKSMQFIVGVVPRGVDLKEQKEWQQLANVTHLRDITDQIRNAKIRGANTDYEKYLEEYRNFLEVIKAGNKLKNQYSVRGLGIMGQRQMADQQRSEQEVR